MREYVNENLFNLSSIDKQIVIEYDDKKITNTELWSESFTLEEGLCSDSELRFGSCESSCLKFKVQLQESLIGKELFVYEYIDGDTENPFVYGYFKVASDKPSADKLSREIVAYDKMYDILNAEVSGWYNKLTYPMTLRSFRNSFFAYLGIEQETTELVNDGINIRETIAPSELSGKEVITRICELNGCFGHINSEGKFEYIFLTPNVESLYPSNDLYPSSTLFPAPSNSGTRLATWIDVNYEDYTTEEITKLQIRQEENDIGAIVGDGDNCYIIQDNFLCYGMLANELEYVAENVLSVVSGIMFTPATINAQGNPCRELGDIIKVNSRLGQSVKTYILKRTLKGIQSLKDTYVAQSSQYQTEEVNSTNRSIIQLRGKTNTLERNVEQTRLTIADVEQNLQAQITINAQGLTTKVSNGEVISSINQSAEKITINAQKIDLQGVVNATEFTSKYATISSLNATNAKVNAIDADYISANTVRSTYATIESLNATNLTVSGKLDASEFTAKNISAMNITVKSANVKGKLTASQIDVEELSASGLRSETLYVSNLFAISGTQNVVCAHVLADDITLGKVSLNATQLQKLLQLI